MAAVQCQKLFRSSQHHWRGDACIKSHRLYMRAFLMSQPHWPAARVGSDGFVIRESYVKFNFSCSYHGPGKHLYSKN